MLDFTDASDSEVVEVKENRHNRDVHAPFPRGAPLSASSGGAKVQQQQQPSSVKHLEPLQRHFTRSLMFCRGGNVQAAAAGLFS